MPAERRARSHAAGYHYAADAGRIAELQRDMAFGASPVRLLLAQPSAEGRFLALPARSQGRSQKAAKGRFGPFDKPPVYDRYLRI
jgi:hypothetical protein